MSYRTSKIWHNINEKYSVKLQWKYIVCNNNSLLSPLWTLTRVLWSWHWQSPDSSYAVNIVHCYNPKHCFFVMLMTSKKSTKHKTSKCILRSDIFECIEKTFVTLNCTNSDCEDWALIYSTCLRIHQAYNREDMLHLWFNFFHSIQTQSHNRGWQPTDPPKKFSW